MACRDPYYQPPARLQPQTAYSEPTADFNPYVHHQAYSQGLEPTYDGYGTGYSDESQYANYYPPKRSQSQRAGNGAFGQGFKESTLETGEPRENVNNPNYFAVNFKEVKADIFYPINNTKVGEGDSKSVVFKANQLTNWTFPFTITYKSADDPQGRILSDLALKCGVNGPKTNVEVKYSITLAIRILIITISPVIENNFNFPCPIDASDLKPLLAGFGLGR
ncbi:hypothetical protein C0993_011650 [Termitomyces sp. T159_Od127]|nr:hypothetical protein C0993_011650 [Termitomyces sp. T159_Od127]